MPIMQVIVNLIIHLHTQHGYYIGFLQLRYRKLHHKFLSLLPLFSQEKYAVRDIAFALSAAVWLSTTLTKMPCDTITAT